MATFNDMVEEVLLNLEGYSGDQAVIGTLSADITDAASTMTLNGGPFADGLGFSTGLVEVGEELVYAQQFNRATGVYAGCLRGWRGTDAVAHVAGEIVRTNPTYPRSVVKRAINDTIANVPLWAVKKTDIATNGNDRYSLPADVDQILRITLSPWGWTDSWEHVNVWNVDPDGNALELPFVASGRTLRVVYSAKPTELSSLSGQFATVTGLPDWCRDAVILGAQWRLTSNMDASRLVGLGVDQAIQAQTSPPGSGQNLSKYLYSAFQSRLAECVQRQQQEWPAQKRWVYGSRR